jgi:CBS domain-containing protein
MNVAAILKAKGRDVATAPSTSTVEAIARQLAERRIGAIVVIGHDGPSARGVVLGIISERDIIRGIATRGAACLSEPVSSLMTRQVVGCRENEGLDVVIAKMTAGRFRHLPVLEDGELVGLISIGDVVKHHIAEVEMEATALKSYLVSG